MKAQVIKHFGDPSVFEAIELPMPTIKAGHAVVKVMATSVNPIDCKIRSGAVAAICADFPAVLHGDFAGVIVTLADDVTTFTVGDEVLGCAGGLKGSSGALAEYMLVDVRLIALKPKSLSMLEAAALPLVCITGWEALFIKSSLTADKTLLIHGGVGGVGHIAVQLAKWCGAKVYATVRKKEDFLLAQSFGAHEVIDAAEPVLDYVARITQGQGFDIVFDTVGGQNLNKSFQAAALNGFVVTTAARATLDLTPLHSKALTLASVFMLLPLLTDKGRAMHGEILTKIAAIVDAGQLKPLIDSHSFNLATISDAHTLLESGNAKGKVVVTIA